jgi:copper chaperone CopZ
MKEIKIHIEGMKCEGCVNRVKNVVGGLKDVSTYDVSLENKELVATVKKEKVIPEILSKIDALGFTASVEE